jgi:hypothetical protein
MRKDICGLMSCDAILVLPGWESSNGAQIETFLAAVLGIPVYSWPDMQRLYPQITCSVRPGGGTP